MKKRLIGFFGLGISLVCFSVALTSCKKSDDPNAQLNAELTVIDKYISDNSLEFDQVLYTEAPVGITYLGDGPIPGKGQTVTIYYRLKLFPAGTLIKTDSLVNVVIDSIADLGLSSVAVIPEQSAATVFVPSPHAYGSKGDATLGIPPNTSITYELFLKSVKKTAAQETQFAKDLALIQSYVDTVKGPPVVTLSNGVRMQVITQGTGNFPKLYDYISFQYEGYVLTNGVKFDAQTLTTVPILNLIEGLRQGIPYMMDGGYAVFYIPSLYAYGTTGSGSIPANAPLIFKIRLNGINQ